MTRDLLARIRAHRLSQALQSTPTPPDFPQENGAPATCLACGGTGKSSRGGACFPCVVRDLGG